MEAVLILMVTFGVIFGVIMVVVGVACSSSVHQPDLDEQLPSLAELGIDLESETKSNQLDIESIIARQRRLAAELGIDLESEPNFNELDIESIIADFELER